MRTWLDSIRNDPRSIEERLGRITTYAIGAAFMAAVFVKFLFDQGIV